VCGRATAEAWLRVQVTREFVKELRTVNSFSGTAILSDQTNSGDHRPSVSIVIAAKDAGAFVATALRSALAQTMKDLEVIVVDDGSVDNTSDVVRACANGDSRVLLLRNDRSLGVSSARNRAISQARGDWIAVLDADDEFMLNRLEVMVGEATQRDLDMLADNLALRDFATKAPVGRAYPADWMGRPELVTFADLLERDMPGLEHKMFGCIKPLMRRSFLMANDITYRDDVWCAEDFLLYAQSILKGARLGVMDEMLYIYSERSDSVSASGPAAHRAVEVARVNRLVGQMAHGRSPAHDRLIRERQTRFDYSAFAQLLKNAQLRKAALILSRVPIGHVATSALAAVARRVKRLWPTERSNRIEAG
jgi:succinoglycan biosynthesis protein ExoO